MGFGEAGQKKAVYILELDGKEITDLREIIIQKYQQLGRVKGDLTEIFTQLQALAGQEESVWTEVTYTGEDIVPDIQEKLQAFTKSFPTVEILSVHDDSKRQNVDLPKIPDMNNITPLQMLDLCFEANNTSQEQREIFIPMYREILRDLGEDY